MVQTNSFESTPLPVGNFTFVLHGAGGDLAKRKIIPALAHLAQGGYFGPQARVVLVQRDAKPVDKTLANIDHFLSTVGDEAARRSLYALKPYLHTVAFALDANQAQANSAQANAAQQQFLGLSADGPAPVVHYAALPSALFISLIALLPCVRDAQQLRLVLEKPLGRSAGEAAAIEKAIAAKLNEDQVYRIDHYLGKQAVQNLLALRLGNRIFEPLLTREHVASVQMTVAEDLGVEGRAAFYEDTGALRDMVQSHLLQLLAIVAMEPPVSLEANALRDEKLKVLRTLKMPSLEGMPDLVFGQYTAGTVHGQAVCGYQEEQGVQANSTTETFVALKTEVQTWRWAGVPFLLRTGKRMPSRSATIVVQFRDVPKALFEPAGGEWAGNKLVIHLQPQDKLELHLLAKSPGERERLRPVRLDLDFFNTWRIPVRDAYERLITDILRGRLGLFLRQDEVAAQWAVVEHILQEKQRLKIVPSPYPSGSFGPQTATDLALRAGVVWEENNECL